MLYVSWISLLFLGSSQTSFSCVQYWSLSADPGFSSLYCVVFQKSRGIPSFPTPMSTPGSGRSPDLPLHSKLNFPPLCLGRSVLIVILNQKQFHSRSGISPEKKITWRAKRTRVSTKKHFRNMERPASELVKIFRECNGLVPRNQKLKNRYA